MSNIIIPKGFVEGRSVDDVVDEALDNIIEDVKRNGKVTTEDDPVYWKPQTEYKGMTCQIGRLNGRWHGFAMDDYLTLQTKPHGYDTENECGRELHKLIDIYRRQYA